MPIQADDEYEVIFRPYITIKGQRIYAWQFGKRAFPLRVRRK